MSRINPYRTDGRVVVSYPKSGRTWLRFALSERGVDAVFTHAGYGTRKSELGNRFKGVQEELKGIPLVFLHRNPLDTAVSMYYQVTKRDFRRGSSRYFRRYLPLLMKGAVPPNRIDDFVLDPLYGVEKVCRFNRAWLDHLQDRDDCLILTYEDLRRDPASGFQQLLDFFGETATTGEELAALAAFERMKAAESGSKTSPFIKPKDKTDPESAKVRKGKVHGYINELKPNTIEACLKVAASFGF